MVDSISRLNYKMLQSGVVNDSFDSLSGTVDVVVGTLICYVTCMTRCSKSGVVNALVDIIALLPCWWDAWLIR